MINEVTVVLDAMARSMAKVNAIKAEFDKHNSVIKLDLQRVDYWQLPLLEWCCDTLGSFTDHKDMSVASFTALFLQREGEVCLTETGVKIEVEDKPQDILIMRMPWGLGLIQLPWLSSLLIDVKWHRGF
ncbi:hypothetical protein CWB96_21375 [Pseudoalteromonas citrea]|uniref:Uncharacterized protein n=1 Tax=Pseudoalteromonas citrea TaxID=43655 RepID=A0A5S3XK15_9GAMM|nr:contractile injection system tape measure protein [Pseudoalteromonas citrea]TMP41770.1 hypothetical protein CWB97_13460 [Pseudoalteromonas citrea]TMP53286.1 hypothetical protein CWB96_21375 [Pseudoalteromonas citrea]